MKSVGLRELKTRLGIYIRMVRKGQRLQVTDRGEVVAEIVPSGSAPLARKYPGIQVLLDEGRLRAGLPNSPEVYPIQSKALKKGTGQDLLDEERGAR